MCDRDLQLWGLIIHDEVALKWNVLECSPYQTSAEAITRADVLGHIIVNCLCTVCHLHLFFRNLFLSLALTYCLCQCHSGLFSHLFYLSSYSFTHSLRSRSAKQRVRERTVLTRKPIFLQNWQQDISITGLYWFIVTIINYIKYFGTANTFWKKCKPAWSVL